MSLSVVVGSSAAAGSDNQSKHNTTHCCFAFLVCFLLAPEESGHSQTIECGSGFFGFSKRTVQRFGVIARTHTHGVSPHQNILKQFSPEWALAH
eukprot:m.248645 g.248645  ORF g.248645 m.248645 type:complete len:94 (+) comp22614_c0_seq6:1682-1963(+)